MSTPERIEELVELLLRGTRNGSLQWQATADEETFRLTSAAANIRLTRSVGFDQDVGESIVSRSLSVLNEKGRVVEEYAPSGATECEKLDDLFTMARRS